MVAGWSRMATLICVTVGRLSSGLLGHKSLTIQQAILGQPPSVKKELDPTNILKVMFTNVSLVNPSHVAKSIFRGWKNELTLMGRTAKGLPTYMERKNLQLLQSTQLYNWLLAYLQYFLNNTLKFSQAFRNSLSFLFYLSYNVSWQRIVINANNIWLYTWGISPSMFDGKEIKWDRKGLSSGKKI